MICDKCGPGKLCIFTLGLVSFPENHDLSQVAIFNQIIIKNQGILIVICLF